MLGNILADPQHQARAHYGHIAGAGFGLAAHALQSYFHLRVGPGRPNVRADPIMKRKTYGRRYRPVAKRARGRRKVLAKRQRGFARIGGFYGRYPQGRELKFHLHTIDSSTFSSTGAVNTSINLIPQGTTEVQRIGRKATIKAILVRGEVKLNDTTNSSNTSDIVRVIIYLDKQANGSGAAVTDILESATWNSFNNLSNKSRFVTIYDKFTTLNSMGAGLSAGASITNEKANFVQFFKRCNIPIEFDSTVGALTEIRSNNIGFLFISKRNALSQFEMRIRLRFEG